MAWTKRPGAVLAVITTCLAAWTLSRVLRHTGGALAVPLDDAYIHFQFARAFARLEPLVYVPGEPAVAGATSLLWPALLAPAALLERLFGLDGQLLIGWSLLLGFAALGWLAHETFLVTEPLADHATAWLAALLVLVFGGHLWCAGSGMEVLPFALLLLRTARRSAEAFEGELSPRELLLLAWLTPLMRPEGVLASLLAAAALSRALGKHRLPWTALALAGVVATPLVNLILTHSAASTTTRVKWLVFNPYLDAHGVLTRIAEQIGLFFGTLLNGELWSALALPQGSRVLAWLALPALALTALLQNRKARGAVLLVVALGILLPATYDTFLVNRLRYLWPFAAPWLVGLACLTWLIGQGATVLLERVGVTRAIGPWLGGALGAVCLFLLGERGKRSTEDLAESSAAISLQQVSLAAWAKDALPSDARIGVNDAGAVTFFSGRRTFDVVGLTTPGEGRYWVAGPGSRFEHYERLSKEERPTHFIVYPEWFALDALLGEELAERTVYSTILGGPTMRAHVADYSLLGSGEKPLDTRFGGDIVDTLDVSDLESEAAHGYELLGALQHYNVLVAVDGVADAGRAGRRFERFEMKVSRGGRVVLRAAVSAPTELEAVFDETSSVKALAEPGPLSEIAFDVPDAIFGTDAHETLDVELELRAKSPILTMHYWSLAQSAPKPPAVAPATSDTPAPRP
jgi:hypothetical protein